jgi:hypothetical protein
MVLMHKKVPKIVENGKLIEYPKDLYLYVNPRTFDLDSEDIESLLAHETLHLGITEHNEVFKTMAKDFGNIAVNELALTSDDGGKYKAFILSNNKWEVLKGFDNLQDAREFVARMQKETKEKFKIA